MSRQDRPSRLTVVGAAVGGAALTAATVAALAMTDDQPASGTGLVRAAAEQDPAQGGEPSATDAPQGNGNTAPAPDQTTTSEPSPGDDAAASESQCPPADSGQQITQREAVSIAEQALAEMGTVPPLREVDLDHDDGLTVWDLEFGADHEVEVDASTGQIVKLERDDD